MLSATSCTPVEMHRDQKKEERDLRKLALHSRSGDISFVFSLTEPTPIPEQGWSKDLGDNEGPLSQMGVGKIVSVMSTIKMDRPQPCLMWQITSLSLRNGGTTLQGLLSCQRQLTHFILSRGTGSHRPLAKLSSVHL